MTSDPRIPVILVEDPSDLAGAGAAVIVAAPASPPPGATQAERFDPMVAGHWIGCGCCTGRSAAAQALDRLFQRRARGQGPWFDRVLALAPAGPARSMLIAAVRQDRLGAARFRLAEVRAGYSGSPT
jgi:hypothetical protein